MPQQRTLQDPSSGTCSRRSSESRPNVSCRLSGEPLQSYLVTRPWSIMPSRPSQKRLIQEMTRPLPHQMRQEVEEEIQAMLALGVIEPSKSEWCSPVVLVPKPNGTQCSRIDFRWVNCISRFNAYPMPRMDELLGCLGEACFITTRYISKGYWQIPHPPHL
ncbi:unnamed protein product [Natator depressus]